LSDVAWGMLTQKDALAGPGRESVLVEKHARDGILFLRAQIIGGVGGRWEYKFTAVSCSFTFPAFFIVICIHTLSLLALLACYKLFTAFV